MIGWLILVLVAIAAGLLLVLIGYPKRLWTVAATALTLGATGYAWQGHPGLPGHPVSQTGQTVEIDPNIVLLRETMFGRYNFSWSYFNAADAMTRTGSPSYAVKVMQGAVLKSPGDAALWTGFGMKLADNDHGVSPAARLAFDKAIALWPKHPGPPFFLGLAYVQSGDFVSARPFWARAVALTPESLSYRQVLMAQLDWLDRMIAAQAEQAARQQEIRAAPPSQ